MDSAKKLRYLQYMAELSRLAAAFFILPTQLEEVYPMENPQAPRTRAEELKAFLLLTGVIAPILAVGIVAGYGFFVWMYQLFTGTLPGGA